MLDGQIVKAVHSDLSYGVDVTGAARLKDNLGIAFMGDTKGGAFDISSVQAQEMLVAPNPHGRSNIEVLRPWINGSDITGRPRGMWIIDFGVGTPLEDAALYEAPFEYVNNHVRPRRVENRREAYAETWWLHVEPRPGLRKALEGLNRVIVTPRISKHRLFVWLPIGTLPDSATISIAKDDDYTFGVLHSKVHEVWALKLGTQLESRPRYTPTTTFETFPFPQPTKPEKLAISEAADQLNTYRESWLNPPEDPYSEMGLESRTLTILYNDRPTWLNLAHQKLDEAVINSYRWPADITNEQILERLLDLNKTRDAA